MVSVFQPNGDFFPVFNVADSAIVIGGCLIVLMALLGREYDGRITRNSRTRVLRSGTVVHEGPVKSLKRFKDDVREVAAGYECGLGLDGFNDLQVGDQVEFFHREEVART